MFETACRPADDDLTSVILTTRLLVFEDSKLDEGTRLMFGYLLDLSLRRSTNVRPGVVTISDTQLSERLGCSRRTIFHRKSCLEKSNHVWLSAQPMPNSWPLTTYHVTAIDPPKAHVEKTTEQGLWGNESRRKRPLGNWLPRGQKTAEKSQVLDIATEASSQLPVSQAASCPGDGKPVAPETGSQLPRRREASCPGDGKPVAHGTGSQLPTGQAASCPHKETKVRDFESTDRALKASKVKALAKSVLKAGNGEAADLVKRCHEILGRDTMVNYGGAWTNRAKSHPELLERVLGEVAAMRREGKVIRHAGACANDLWDRWSK
jgi:hypothetical protein